MDVTAAFRGVTTPVHKLVGLIEDQGWEPGKVGFSDGQYTASASFEGEKVERTGPDQATALANVLKVIVRKHHMRSKVQEHLGMEAPKFLDRLEEIATEYAKATVYDPKAAIAWKELADDSTRRVETLAEQITIEYTDDPFPYINAQELREDVQDKRHLSVTTANAEHPVWTLEQMLAFRVVHDVMGYTVAGAEFGWHGENLAFEAHRKLLSHTAQQALFTETIGQVAATTFFGQLPQIKIVFLEAFGEQAPHPGHHPSQTVAPIKHVHAAEGIWGDELDEPEGGWDQWGGEPTWGLAEPCPFCHSKNTGLRETPIGLQGNCSDCLGSWKPNLTVPNAPPAGHPLDWTAKVAAAAPADPNYGWQSGIEPHPQNAYLWHGDPLQGHQVMDNASLVDTGWAQFKREDGSPDLERMKQAIVNAFRASCS
jgi:hypothetical protein